MAGIQATRRTLGLRPVGSSHRVPPNDTARLMYYLRCVTLGLGMDILADRLIEDDHWARLSASDVDAVYLLALELSPDEFLNKALFHDADGTFVGDCHNKFYEAEAVTERVTVTSAFTLRGTSTTASKVMFFRNAWLDEFYLAPMRRGVARLTRIAAGIADAGHCRHCKGGAGACACTDGCRRQPDSRCAPTLASLLSAMSVRLGAAAPSASAPHHCDHCAGKAAACACTAACGRPAAARCTPANRHCAHCAGAASVCACERGCARPPAATCYHEHPSVRCDGCGAGRVRGDRYTCAACHDFDLCGDCYGGGRHDQAHPFVKRARPGGGSTLLAPRRRLPSPTRQPRRGGGTAAATPPASRPATAAAPRLGCRSGERRRVVGTSRADLNGTTVVVADPVAGNGRAEVVFPSGEHCNVRFENLARITEDLD